MAIERTAAFSLTFLAACISPSVVESSGRAVAAEASTLDWRPATASDLRGLYESTAIEGEVAASLWRVYYHFSVGGSYTGAALLVGDPPQFQTLSGTWSLADGQLDLGQGQVVRASVAGEQLKLESEGGVAVLRRAAVQ